MTLLTEFLPIFTGIAFVVYFCRAYLTQDPVKQTRHLAIAIIFAVLSASIAENVEKE